MVKKKYGIKKSLFKSKGFKKAAFLTLFAFISVAFFAFGGLDLVKTAYINVQKMFAGEEELGRKELTDNHDGTYNLSLTVKGQAEKKPAKLNVIVIVDRSGSMNDKVVTVQYESTTGNGDDLFGKVGDEYVPLQRLYGNYTEFTGTPENTNYYRWDGDSFERVYYNNGTWYQTRTGNQYYGYRYSNPYDGKIYTVSNTGTRYYYTSDGTRYTGTRYERTEVEGSESRMSATKSAVNTLANKLFANNGGENPADTVEMALVTFGSTASTQSFGGSVKTANKTTFTNAVEGITIATGNNAGTNWEAALKAANNINFGDQDPTFVIFFSDGNPTFYSTSGGYYGESSLNVSGTTVYGTGREMQNGQVQTTNMDRSYNAAKDDASTLATKVGTDHFYTIFAFGDIYNDTDYMKNLTEAAGAPTTNNYNASNTESLQQAFADILAKIEMAGISDATINDGTTNNVVKSDNSTAELLEVDETSYKYWRTINGTRTEWKSTDEPAPPAAHLETSGSNKGHVVWDLSGLHLLDNDVIYEVTFDVYPSQFTYDIIADLKNGKYTYNSLDSEIKKYLQEDGKGGYTLRTNTTANMTYKDTRITDPDDEHYGTQTYNYTNPDPVATAANELVVQKLWDNDIDKRNAAPITMELKKNGTVIETFNLSNDNDFKDHIYIATGLLRTRREDAEDPDKITGIQVLDTGYEFSLNEPEYANGQDRYWEFSSSTIRPMIVDNVLSTLVKVENEEDIPTEMSSATYAEKNGNRFFKIDGSVYYLKDQATEEEPNKMTFSGTNSRKSVMEVKKLVENDAPAGEEFKFTFNITNSTDKEVWFSVCDNSKVDCSDPDAYQAVKGLNTTATPEDGDTGYYHVNNGVSFDVYMQKDYNLRFINLGTGSTYSVEEEAKNPYITTIESDTIVSSVREVPLTAVPQADGKTWINTDGTKYEKKTDSDGMTYYEFTYRATRTGNKVEGSVIAANTAFTVTYTNTYPRTFVKVDKVWKQKEGTDPIEVTLYENGQENSTSKGSLTKDNGWTYTFKDLEVKDGNGEQIKYSVKETVPEGYKASYDGTTDVLVKLSNVPEETNEVTITAGGKSATLTRENNFEGTINGVDFVEDNGNLITIEVTANVEGVTIASELTNRNIVITNAELTTATVVKEWNDDNNRDGLRKAVEMTLTANGTPTSTKVTLTEDKDKEWKATVEGLDKYDADGEEITYSWTETVLAGYELESTSYDKDTRTTTIKNKHVPELVNIKVTKDWDDKNNQDGKRPDKLLITLKGDGNSISTYELLPTEGWSHTFEGLFKYNKEKPGTPINYTVEETLVGNEYTYVKTTTEDLKEGDKVVGTSFTIENTHTIAKTNICVNKVWNDNNDQDGYRPDKLIVNLLINGEESGKTAELNAGNGWSFTWENLDAYKDGALLSYSVDEASVPDHYTQGETTSADLTDKDGNVIGKSYTLNNNHEIEKTFRTIIKDWDDADDQDGARPEKLVVTLKGDGEAVGTVTLSEENGWTGTISDLPVKAAGEEITYLWDEGSIEGYELTGQANKDVTMTVEGTQKTLTGIETTLTNTHEPELTVVAVKKVWNDNDDQDGYRPDNLTVTLKVGDETKGTVTLSEDNNWEDMITNLPKYADGEEIEYVWVEDSIDDYELTDTTNEPIRVTDEKTGITTTGIKYTLTNTHIPEKTKVTVIKDWDDAENQDGMRPADLTVTLTANGTATSTTKTLTESNGWKESVEGLDVFANGEPIDYSWSEPEINGYKPNGVTKDTVTDKETGKVKEIIITLTNTHETEKTSRTVKKAWDDANNQDGYRPASVTVNLQVNNKTIDSVTLSENNQWTATISDLDTYADGNEIEYVWSEVVPGNYTLDKSETVGKVTTITNKHVPETTEVAIEKVWNDADNQDGYRPNELNVALKAGDKTVDTVTLNKENNWKASKTGLPKKADGKDIVYSWDEGDIEHYELTDTKKDDITRENKVVGVKYTLTNSHETEEVEIQVEKVWVDADDQDGYRPDELNVALKAGDKTIDTVTLNEGNEWKASKTGLPKKADGKDITYSWDEGTVDEYELTTTTESIKDDKGNVVGTKFILTNTHVPEEVEIQVEKVWVDNDDQDGYRPDKLNVALKAGDKTIDTVTLNERNEWKASKTGLPKKVDGTDIVYSWDEGTVAEYDLSTATESIKDDKGNVIGTKFILTNTHETEQTQATIKKVWDDNNDQDGKRPGSLTVKLLADGNETGKSVTLSDSNNWEDTIKELDTKANGTDIVYSWDEGTVAEYTVTGNSTQGTVTTITNKHIPEEISVTITKSWDDETNNDGVRPASIIVHLLANGTQVGENITLAAEDWTKTITGLPKYADGEAIKYTVTEDDIANYSQTDYESVDGTDENNNVISTSVTITNTHTISKTNICVTKAWDDASNQDNYRPDHVLINVLAETDNKQATIVASYTLETKDVGDDEDHWTYTFEDMPEYDEGLPITYTIEEVLDGDTPNYYTQVGDPTESELKDDEGNVIGKNYEITNKHETDKTEITVKKAWDDANDQDGKRPESVAITLYADGEEVETVDVTAKDAPNANTWTYTWTGLEKNKRVDGVTSEIVYTVDEKDSEEESNVPEGYEKVGVDKTGEKEYTITNKHIPEKVTVSGEKKWDMTANIYGFKNLPSSIEIKLMKGETEVDSQTVVPDEKGDWKYSFEDLDKYENKEPITYTVTETPIKDYDTEIIPESDYVINVKNTYNPEPAELNGTKTWVDNTDQDGARPKEIKITLVAMVDGEKVYREEKPRTITGPENYNETNWSFTFNDLPARTTDGKDITWVAEETLPDGYTRIDDTITLDIVNQHTPELVSYTVRKVWDDDDNAEGLRPSKVVFYLDADGDEIAQGEANEDNDWTVTFPDLPKFRDHGTAIEYTVREDKVKNYDEPVIEKIGDYESTVTNIQLVNIHIIKTWNDNNNEFNVRPDQIIVDIFGDGELIDTITITSKDNWTYTYPGLPKYNEDGEAIEYTLREKPIEHYIPTYEKFNIFNDVDPDSIEIIPPDTGVDSPEKNIGVLYLIVALVSVLGAGLKKVFE